VLITDFLAAGTAVVPQQFVHPRPNFWSNNSRLLTGVNRAFMVHLARVQDIGEQSEQSCLGKGSPGVLSPVPRNPLLGRPSPDIQFLDDCHQGAAFQIEREDGPDPLGLLFVHQ